MMPYLTGPKKADCAPMRKTHPSTSHGPTGEPWLAPSQNPSSATKAMPTSSPFHSTVNHVLL
jgi:hypothetical protein